MIPLPIIAIDGPSASGKGTLARGLAAALGFAHLETGLLYRWVGKQWLEAGGSKLEASALDLAEKIARDMDFRLRRNDGLGLLNDPELRTNQVAEAASVTSAHPPVRAALLELQREFARNPQIFFSSPFRGEDAERSEAGGGEKTFSNHPHPAATQLPSPLKGEGKNFPQGAILDGRDIASVVCPDADVKFFVTASPEIRAQRRTKELQSLGEPATYEQVLQDVRVRDHRDQTRETAPLLPTAGSIEIDTSNLSAQEALDFALGIIRRTRPQH